MPHDANLVLIGLAVVAAGALGGAVTLLVARGLGASRGDAATERGLAHIVSAVRQVAEAQSELRRDVRGAGESSLRELAEVARGLHGELGSARRSLAELGALEAERARQSELATRSLRRLEAVMAGSSSRGAAGENILARSIGQLPPDLLETRVSFGSRVVEYALRLPDGRLVPIDSKWPAAAGLERLAETDDPEQRRRIADAVGREVRSRARELARYLDPERTLRLGVIAVPDAVFFAVPEVHGAGYREGILIVPYSLVLPYLLALYRLCTRLTSAPAPALDVSALGESLRRAEEEVEGRLSRALVQLSNARDALRSHLAESAQCVARGVEASGSGSGPAEPGVDAAAGPRSD